MRQRTISDYFWRDPEICDLSQEDKATLLYFLTSPSSNIIGVYQIIWRIAAAEMGWTTDQLMVVVRRLQSKGLIDCTEEGWIWVKTWWKHNSASGAFSPKLISNAKKQCAAMPSEWFDRFLESLGKNGINRVSIGYASPIDTLPGNTTGISISNPTTTTTNAISVETDGPAGCEALEFPKGLSAEVVNAITELMQQVQDATLERKQELLDELANAMNTNSIRSGIVPFFRSLIQSELQGKFTPCGGIAVRVARKTAAKNKAAMKLEVKIDIDPAASSVGRKMMDDAAKKRLGQKA